MKQYQFHKGLRLDRPETELKPGEMPELTNFIYGDEQGLLQKRRGLSRVVSSLLGVSPIRGLHRSSVGGTNPHTLVVSGGSVYRVLDDAPSWDPVFSGLNADNPVRFDTWKEKTYIVTGADALHAWDGSTVSEVAGAPAGCRFVQQFADRLFVGSSAQFPDTLFYSDLLDPTVWVDEETGIQNSIDVSTGDDQKITGVLRGRDQLTIYKTKASYYLYGYDPEEWVLQRVSDSVGCIAPGSLLEMDGRSIYLSSRGVYLDDGKYFYQIGAAIQPFVKTLSQEQQEAAVATTDGWNYYLFFPDTPEGPAGFVYHVRLEAWTRWNLAVPIGVVCRKDLPSDAGGWIAGSAVEGLIFHGETGGDDDGEAIAARLRLPAIGLDTPEITKDVRYMALDAEADTLDAVTLSLQVDGHAPVERAFSGSTPTLYSVPRGQVGRVARIAVEIDGTGTSTQVHGVAADIQIKRRLW